MGGYIGATAVGLTTTAADVQGDITSTDTTPELILKNTSEEDTEGGREGKITFKGEQSGGEESTLAQIESAHDGTSDDQKGDLIFKTNDGSDGASPTERMRIDSGGTVNITSPSNARALKMQNSANNSASQITFLSDDGTEDSFVRNNASTVATDSLSLGTGGTERMRIDSLGNVGIGVTPKTGGSTWQHIQFGGTGNIIARTSDSTVDAIFSNNYYINSSGTDSYIATGDAARMFFNDDVITFSNAGSGSADAAISWSERMRINSDGHFLVATTNDTLYSSSTDQGMAYRASGGQLTINRASGQPLILNRLTNDGDIIQFRKDGTSIGSVGSYGSGGLFIESDDVGLAFRGDLDSIYPVNNLAGRDNAIDLGLSSVRFDDIYATNGTIQTSDENEKQQIASLTDAEMTAAKAISKLFKTFKWNDSVAENGDDARTHTGVIAQQVETAMSDAGLDAGNYAFFISTTWWETQTEVAAVEADEENGIEAQDAYTRTDQYHTQEEAPEGATERNRKGIRYPELLAFIGAATEQRLTSIEARLDALEG